MPAQILSRPNPPPEKSLLPQDLGQLAVKLDLNVLSQQELDDVKAFRRAADYIAAGESTATKRVIVVWTRIDAHILQL